MNEGRQDGGTDSRQIEENVWKVCEFIRKEKSFPLEEFFVIFISNDNKMVPLWEQKSAQGQQPVIWDYHVVLLHVCASSEAFLYDLDSVLPFPCNLKMYAKHALRTDHSLSPEYHRKLRVVPADCFLLNFASDRSHMKKEDGSWTMPPPPYPPIRTADSSMNLQLFISMEPSVGWGHIFTLDHFLCHFLKDPCV
ncbi:protein N-terminal glutamine amidohydrolase isoform X2 [Nerophis lumbriciformis]|uniref:protein N-terminal glutamine amidohydrolase isoform X2 n=1 Tax=Nerophis lumbriciformis TaxID=546530 RepID=UPI002ADF6B36|nr:protein N-terminal glutamine amidohydrolase isoform X2 [Nerophis lumbriciformis]